MQVQSIDGHKYHHSPETIQLIKKRLTGQRRTLEQRKNYSEAKRGERSPSARLSTKQVREIRQRIIAGETYRQFVEEFSVTWQNIRAVHTRKTWRHLPFEKGEKEFWEAKGRHLNERGTWIPNVEEEQ